MLSRTRASASPASPTENGSEQEIAVLGLMDSVPPALQTFPWSNTAVLRTSVQSSALRLSARRAWLESPRAEGALLACGSDRHIRLLC